MEKPTKGGAKKDQQLEFVVDKPIQTDWGFGRFGTVCCKTKLPCMCVYKRKEWRIYEWHRKGKTHGWGSSRRDEWTAVNFDSWPLSRESSILMVVLRAEREGGWLILGYDTPPTRYCSAHAAELEMSKQWLLEKVSVSECVCVGGGRGWSQKVWEHWHGQKKNWHSTFDFHFI